MTTIEARVRAMTKADRRAHLHAHGWTRLGPRNWRHPSHNTPSGDRSFYTLAAAIRKALAQDPA